MPGQPTAEDLARARAAEAMTVGYLILHQDGSLEACGAAVHHGSAESSPVVDVAARPDSSGYWILRADSYVESFGSVPDLGQLADHGVVTTVVGLEPTPSGDGYWITDARGGVFCFGDAGFFGSVPEREPTSAFAAVCLRATPTGMGYWVVGRDGRVEAFGDAAGRGIGAVTGCVAPVVDLRPTLSAGGYWVLDAEGGVTACGDAEGEWSTSPVRRSRAVRLLAADGLGYLTVHADGVVVPYGLAVFLGSATGGSDVPVVAAAMTSIAEGISEPSARV